MAGEDEARKTLESLLAAGSTLQGPTGSSISTPAQGAPGGFDPTGGTGTAIVGKVNANPSSYEDPKFWSSDINAYWGIEVLDDLQAADRSNYPKSGAGGLAGMVAGEGPRNGEGPGGLAGMGATTTPRSVGHIIQTLLNMSSRERILLQTRLKKAGYLGDNFKPGAADDETVGALGNVLMETAREGLASGESVSWQDYLDQRIQNAESPEAKAAATKTFTQTATSVTSKESGRGVIWDAFREAVGRNPTESEIDKFMAKLNAAEKAHPAVTTTTTTPDGSSSSSTSGGFDNAAQADLVRKEVQSNDQYAEYQAAAYYMPLLFQALDSTTNLEGGL